jgi:hypothetical protein
MTDLDIKFLIGKQIRFEYFSAALSCCTSRTIKGEGEVIKKMAGKEKGVLVRTGPDSHVLLSPGEIKQVKNSKEEWEDYFPGN